MVQPLTLKFVNINIQVSECLQHPPFSTIAAGVFVRVPKYDFYAASLWAYNIRQTTIME
jgi:hypothetical protein